MPQEHNTPDISIDNSQTQPAPQHPSAIVTVALASEHQAQTRTASARMTDEERKRLQVLRTQLGWQPRTP